MEEKRVPLSLMNVFPLRNFKMKFKGISITHGHGERWVRLRLCLLEIGHTWILPKVLYFPFFACLQILLTSFTAL